MNTNAYQTINIRMLLKVTGWLLMTEAVFMLFPFVTALVYHEEDALPLGIIAAVTAVTGIGMQGIRARHKTMGRREGFLLTASVWVWFSVFGMLPFIFGSSHFSVSDAFFEAMSGFTTTGASILDDHSVLSHGLNIWRSLMQWIGGMGIILFTLAVIPMLNSSGGMQMFNAEVSGITHDKVRPRISSTAKALWGTYIVLTLILFVLLYLGPMGLFDSIFYTFSTISTGGFDPTAESLARFGSDYVYVVMTVFMFLGGVSFSLIFQAVCGNVSKVLRNDVLRVFMAAIALIYAIFAVTVLVRSGGTATWQEYTVYPLFEVVSTITSTGLGSGRFVWWTPLLTGLMMAMMFTGACAGSTSGGAKLDRVLMLVKYLANEIVKCVRPNAILSVRLNGRVAGVSTVEKVTAFMCLYVLVILVGGLALMAMGIPLFDAFFSSFACVSNTGFSATLTGYGATYAIVPDVAKWLLAWLMLVGRLEIFTVLILFTRQFWRK